MYYIKVGFKGVKIIQACSRDGEDSDQTMLLILSHTQWLLWIFRDLFAEGLRGSRGPMKSPGQSLVGSSVHLGLLCGIHCAQK